MTPKEELERKIELLDQSIELMRLEINNRMNDYCELKRKRQVLIEELALSRELS